MTPEQIAHRMQSCINRCEHFKSSRDGSYGLALANTEYYEMKERLEALGYEFAEGKAVKID